MRKIILITNIPNPYRVPLYNELHLLFKKNNFSFKVIFGASGYKRRLFTLDKKEIHFDYEILKGKGHNLRGDIEKTVFLYSGLTKKLKSEKPDIIIVAGFSTATLKVFRYHLFNNIPYIIISGTIEKGKRKISFIRRIQRKILANHAEAFISYGTLSKQHLIQSGVPENKIFIGRNTVDTTFFESQTLLHKNNNESDGIFHFTYLGYLVPRKNVMAVLKAIKLLSKTENNFILDVVGDGISKNELEQFSYENSLDKFIHFHGFRQKDEIPRFLAKCNCFLFQTNYDIWGLVLNEAMAAGLPCIASLNAGATYDLIENGITGYIIDYDDTNAVVNLMKWAMQHPAQLKTVGNNASEYMKNHVTLSHSTEGYMRAVNFVLETD